MVMTITRGKKEGKKMSKELQLGNYDLDKPQGLVEFANVLKKAVVEKDLFSKIQGKNYVNVEGWQFAGLAMGIVPVVKRVDRQTIEGEIRYRAEVELVRFKDGSVVGAGVGICSDKEKSDRRDEYAIASMAQTRAISRAYRNGFGWLMKMAGYETTPAEEAVTSTSEDVRKQAEKELEELDGTKN